MKIIIQPLRTNNIIFQNKSLIFFVIAKCRLIDKNTRENESHMYNKKIYKVFKTPKGTTGYMAWKFEEKFEKKFEKPHLVLVRRSDFLLQQRSQRQNMHTVALQ